ncbi:MAG: restriction endonuclease subunit S [Faecalibacterium sp.]|nr:restriction endonuclease subunit S [Faecalibacterium sp.]MDY5504891.1 restriction endonuclease subunit S [Faecalibacterium sp.]
MARKMKDSGIEWIGEIPEGWEVIKAKYLFSPRNEKGNSTLVLLSPTQKYGVIPQSQLEGVVQVKENTDLQSFKTIHYGDFVISLRSFQGGFEFSNYEGVCSPAYQVFHATKDLSNDFFRYLFKSDGFISKINSLTVGIREGKNIQYWDFSNMLLALPPKKVQIRSAQYLNAKCIEIDTMLSKTRSSIEEYKKLKQAVITQAVTKGVRGEREMKDSGVEWIGEIPEEWNKCKLKNISIDIGDGLHGTPKFDDSGEVYFINGNNFSSEYVEPKFDTKKLCLEESLNYPKPELTEQTIMISLNGSYGKVCLYRYFPMLLGKSAGYITLLPSINRRYVRYYLSSTPAQIIMTLSLNGTTIPNLSLNTLYNFPTILPPASEQAEIADYLDAKCAEIDKLIAKKEQLVKELESYKKSLIYEVVTGKREV